MTAAQIERLEDRILLSHVDCTIKPNHPHCDGGGGGDDDGGGETAEFGFGWALNVGAEGNDRGWDLGTYTDEQGNDFLYVAGGIESGTAEAEFDPNETNPSVPSTLTSEGVGDDAYVAKYTADGTFLWVRQIGSRYHDKALRLAVDGAGNVHVAGLFSHQAELAGGSTTLVAPDVRLGMNSDPSIADGETFTLFDEAGQSATFEFDIDDPADVSSGNVAVPITSDDTAEQIAQSVADAVNGVGDSLNVTVTTDPDSVFPVILEGVIDFDEAISDLRFQFRSDAFVAKYSPDGQLVWAESFGGPRNDAVFGGLALDAAQNVYVAGINNRFGYEASGEQVFVRKLDADGNEQWVHRRGSSETLDGVLGIEFHDGAVVFSGLSWPSPDFSALNEKTAYVAKLDAADGTQLWSQEAGPKAASFGVTVDSTGNVWATGQISSTVDFDPGDSTTDSELSLNKNESGHGFIWKLDRAGNFLWVGQVGGKDNTNFNSRTLTGLIDSGDSTRGITTDATDAVYISGQIIGKADLDPGGDRFVVGAKDVVQGFVLKLDNAGNFIQATAIGGGGTGHENRSLPLDITLDSAENIYLTGLFETSADFDPTDGTATLTSNGEEDMFLVKLTQPTGSALLVEGRSSSDTTPAEPLTQAALEPVLSRAVSFWAETGGDVNPLNSLDVRLTGLNGAFLGVANTSGSIWLDRNAAGFGWSDGNSAGGVNLLSVLTHEVGHVLGFGHSHDGVMAPTLVPGTQFDSAPLENGVTNHPLENGLGRAGLAENGSSLLFVDSRFSENNFADSGTTAAHDQAVPLDVLVLRSGDWTVFSAGTAEDSAPGEPLTGESRPGDGFAESNDDESASVDRLFADLDEDILEALLIPAA